MIKKKICMVGPFAVGKTSLVRKFVLNVFSDDYLSTVGVKVDKKNLVLKSGENITLLIWDLEGHKVVDDILPLYLRGMAAYFLVADGTSVESIETVQTMAERLFEQYPGVPCVCLLNKADLKDKWAVNEKYVKFFEEKGIPVLTTSAKTGDLVETAFKMIAEKAALDGADA